MIVDNNRNPIINIENMNFRKFPPKYSDISIMSELAKFLNNLAMIKHIKKHIIPINSMFTILPVPS